MVFTVLTIGIAVLTASRTVERAVPAESLVAFALIALVMIALLFAGLAG